MSNKAIWLGGKLNSNKQSDNNTNKQTGKDVKLLDDRSSVNYGKK